MADPVMIDGNEELAETRLGALHLRLGVLMALLTFFDGYDTFNPTYVIHYVMRPWHLQPSQAGLLVSSGLLGFLGGTLIHGPVADRFGRRVALVAGLWIASLFTLLTAMFGNSFGSFCLLRVLTGLGLGVLLPLATTYINELAPRRIANRFSIWGVGLGWALGGTAAGLVGVFLTPEHGWRALYWVGALSIPLALVLPWLLPESIRYLIARGRTEEARALLIRLRPERAALYRDAAFQPQAPREAPGSVAALLSPRYRRTSLTIWLAAFLSLFCIFGLTSWIPTVMMRRGESFGASFGFGALMQIMSFVGGLCCGYVADRSGSNRLALAIWWMLGAAVMLFLFQADSHLANVAGITGAGFLIMGPQFVLNNFTAQSYDTELRASAVGTELGMGRFGAILGPFVIGMLQQVFHGPGAVFVAIGCAALTAGVAVLALARERRLLAGFAVRPPLHG